MTILHLAMVSSLHCLLNEVHLTPLCDWVHFCAISLIMFLLVPNGNTTSDIAINMVFLVFVVVAETVRKISLCALLGDNLGSGANSKQSNELIS